MAKYGVGDIVRDKESGDRWRIDKVTLDRPTGGIYGVTKIEADGDSVTYDHVTLSERYYELDTSAASDRVIALWLANDCWIPGVDYKRLAEALGVDPSRLENDRTRAFHERQTARHAKEI